MGFLAAMQHRYADWQPLRDLSRIEHGLLLPTLLHFTDTDGHPCSDQCVRDWRRCRWRLGISMRDAAADAQR
jgi:hypothetical protein